MKKDTAFGTISITSFTYCGSTIKVKKGCLSLPVSYETQRDGYVVESEDLGVYAFSKTKQGLTRALKEELEIAWDLYALKPSKYLDRKDINSFLDGLQLKKNLLKIFKEEI